MKRKHPPKKKENEKYFKVSSAEIFTQHTDLLKQAPDASCDKNMSKHRGAFEINQLSICFSVYEILQVSLFL